MSVAILVLLVRGITMRNSWIWYSLASVLLLNCPAQSSEGLPQCPNTPIETWDSCVGSAQQVSYDGYLGEYIGGFKGGKRSGQGVFTRISHSWGGEKYIGEFSDGQFSGQGAYLLNSGLRTVGQWVQGRLNGPAVIFAANGSISSYGIYREGVLVQWDLLTETERQFARDYRRVARKIYRDQKNVRPGLTVEQRRDAKEYLEKVAELKEAERLAQQAAQQEQYRIAERRERERIEREGDGSTDDLACKGKKLIPATDPYRNCRAVLVADRERKAQRERELAEKQERDRAERERVAAAEAEAASHRYYEKLEREGRAALARARALTAAREADPFYDFKAQCRNLGFKPNTEKFGTCVLELSRRQPREETPVVQSGDGSPDDTTCRGYGFSVGTSGYSNCRMTLDNARRSYELELRAYESAKAEYQRRAVEAEAEARRAQSQRQSEYGFCVAACSAQSGATLLSCAARCGSRSAGVAYDPGVPPVPPSGRTTYLINGRIVNCNTFGSFVTCN